MTDLERRARGRARRRIVLDAMGLSGCSDNSCMFGLNAVGTNGGCRCIENLDGPRMSHGQKTFIRRMAEALRLLSEAP